MENYTPAKGSSLEYTAARAQLIQRRVLSDDEY